MKGNSLQPEDLKDKDRTLVVVVLQSLHREWVTSWNAAVTACSLAGKTAPSGDTFGIDDVTLALRRIGIGAAPQR